MPPIAAVLHSGKPFLTGTQNQESVPSDDSKRAPRCEMRATAGRSKDVANPTTRADPMTCRKERQVSEN